MNNMKKVIILILCVVVFGCDFGQNKYDDNHSNNNECMSYKRKLGYSEQEIANHYNTEPAFPANAWGIYLHTK